MRRSKIECEPLILIYVQLVVLAQHVCDTGSDTGDHSLTGTSTSIVSMVVLEYLSAGP